MISGTVIVDHLTEVSSLNDTVPPVCGDSSRVDDAGHEMFRQAPLQSRHPTPLISSNTGQ